MSDTRFCRRDFTNHELEFLEPTVVAARLGDLGPIEVRPVAGRSQSATWNELTAAHHDLGYVPLCGAQLRYLAYGSTEVVAALSFTLGLEVPTTRRLRRLRALTREARLHLVVGNVRFLILEQAARVPHLASKLLSLVDALPW